MKQFRYAALPNASSDGRGAEDVRCKVYHDLLPWARTLQVQQGNNGGGGEGRGDSSHLCKKKHAEVLLTTRIPPSSRRQCILNDHVLHASTGRKLSGRSHQKKTFLYPPCKSVATLHKSRCHTVPCTRPVEAAYGHKKAQ